MSTISPMTFTPQPAKPADAQPVVSLQQRVADRLSKAAPDSPAPRPRQRKERGAEEAGAVPAHLLQQPARGQDALAFALRRDGATSTAEAPSPAVSSRRPAEDPTTAQPVPSARDGDASTGATLRASSLMDAQRVATTDPAALAATTGTQVAQRDEPAATPGDPATTTPAADATTATPIPAAGPTPARVADMARPPVEAPREQAQRPSAMPAATSPAPVESPTSSITVAFDSWGPGHEVRAQWTPGSGVLVPGSERVGQALAAATSQPDAGAIAADGWRIERSDADPDADHRQRQSRDPEQDA